MKDFSKGFEENPNTADYFMNERKGIQIDIKEQRNVKKQLLLTPSLMKQLKKEAKAKHTSVNNLINLILEAYFNQYEQ